MKETKKSPTSKAAPKAGLLRMTIARKIGLAVVAIVVLCVATMAWVTSQNLNRGFLTYLDQLQLRELAPVRDLISARYQQEGNFEWLRRNPQEMRKLLEQVRGRPNAAQADPRAELRQQRRQRALEEGRPEGRDRRDRPDRPEFERRNFDQNRPPPFERDGPPPPERDGPPPEREEPPLPRDGPPERAEPPPANPRGAAGANPEPTFAAPNPPPPPRLGQSPRDPMAFGARLSIVDAQGRKVIGPNPPVDASVLPIIVDGKTVGQMYMARLDQIGAAEDASSALKFVRGQVRDMAWLALLLSVLAILLAIFLARHFLRPIAALRIVTEKIARGQFAARAPVMGSDELAQLANHVNQMAQALGQSEQQRRQMMADIAHELRTPLTVIRGEIEALLDGIRKLDRKAMESLHVEVLRLNKMIDDVHQLTLVDVGDLHFHFQEVDLAAMLEPILSRYELRANKAGLELSWDLPTVSVLLQVDAGRLTQVITNLLENSVRYTDAGGRIVLAMRIISDCVILQLDDSAPGVPTGAHARLFERLYRVDQARSRERGGSGLGLSICLALIQAHGGSIEALPSSLGGVQMLIRLPLKRASIDKTNKALPSGKAKLPPQKTGVLSAPANQSPPLQE